PWRDRPRGRGDPAGSSRGRAPGRRWRWSAARPARPSGRGRDRRRRGSRAAAPPDCRRRTRRGGPRSRPHPPPGG
ncbi:MAG: class E sortase, partial [Alphaproteobacteria bacterium]|nr:class E sortase [Alphaproteobacteria bacterium]